MPKIDLLTKMDVHSTQDAAVNTWVTADHDDPQLRFTLDRPLDKGWYRLEAQIDTDGDVDPQVFFDFGGGFSEAFSVRLAPSKGGEAFGITVKLPHATSSVRLDPISSRGKYRVAALTIERVQPSHLLLSLARFGMAVMRADPRNFVQRLPKYLQALMSPHFLKLGDPTALASVNTAISYRNWIARHDFEESRDSESLRHATARVEYQPLISVLMPVYNTPESFLREAIESVRNQLYENWELCIADDNSTKSHVRTVLAEYVAQDSRIKVMHRAQNGHISEATNSAFELADGEWVALLDHDDVLRPHALAEVVLQINRHPDVELVYSDEDKLDDKGRRYDPHFKPDFSRELFRSQNYLNHLTVHRATNIRAVGGWRKGFEGSQDYDLNLRVMEQIDTRNIRHIPKILYHWRAVEGSTALAADEKGYAYRAGFLALQEHIKRTNLDATVEEVPDMPFYRVRLSVPKPEPLVSLIIPTRDKVHLLRGCVESILRRTTYKSIEIIVVDNDSDEHETLAYLEKLRGLSNVKVLTWSGAFNYSAINNFAVSKASGDVIGLINNDIEVISPDWLTEMVSWAVQPDVGCVGAKLYYQNDTIQHAGVVLGIGGVAGHIHKYFPRQHRGYFGRLRLVQNLSAVTGACLLIDKQLYLEVGGLNERDLKVAFNDVDLCLKVRHAGYLNVWTPFAELYHLESVSRGAEDSPDKVARFNQEASYMRKNWKLDEDEYYSVNLSLSREDFSYRT